METVLTSQRVEHLHMVFSTHTRITELSKSTRDRSTTGVGGGAIGIILSVENLTRGASWMLPLIGAIWTLGHWALNAVHLRDERIWRGFFSMVRVGEVEPYFMDATSQLVLQRSRLDSWFRTLWRPVLIGIYGLQLAAIALVAVYLAVR